MNSGWLAARRIESHAHSQATPPARGAYGSQGLDVVVAGAGIVGLAVTRELRLRWPRLRLRVIERERDVGVHQTGHNSGVIHSGIYYYPGSLKAQLCRQGARELYEYCDQRQIAVKRCGKVIVATTVAEHVALEDLEARGRANGITRMRRLSAGQLSEVEPHVRGVPTLHVADTGVVDFGAVAQALADDLFKSEVAILRGCTVAAMRCSRDEIVLQHSGGHTHARHVICCAGAWGALSSRDILASTGARHRRLRRTQPRGAVADLPRR